MSNNAFVSTFKGIGSYLSICWSRFCSGLYSIFIVLLWTKLFGPNDRPSNRAKMAAKTPRSSDDVDTSNTPPSVRNIRQHHSRSYEYITQALVIDEGEGIYI